jgi:hypothetical protein
LAPVGVGGDEPIDPKLRERIRNPNCCIIGLVVRWASNHDAAFKNEHGVAGRIFEKPGFSCSRRGFHHDIIGLVSQGVQDSVADTIRHGEQS